MLDSLYLWQLLKEITNLQQDCQNQQSWHQTSHLRIWTEEHRKLRRKWLTARYETHKVLVGAILAWLKMSLAEGSWTSEIYNWPVFWRRCFPGPRCEKRSSWQQSTETSLQWCYTDPGPAGPEAGTYSWVHVFKWLIFDFHMFCIYSTLPNQTLLFMFALHWDARAENSDLLSVVSTADLTMRLKKEVVAVNGSKKIMSSKKGFEGNQSLPHHWG